ncbi:uncharacterized protein VTP21DRAFT_1724 [Calcarisporiella thermophila]|uniref:uncharacterized protein n=1 Tax=Calcarisporiella thermophila TaxID=911321 RepID=UPI0037435C7A
MSSLRTIPMRCWNALVNSGKWIRPSAAPHARKRKKPLSLQPRLHTELHSQYKDMDISGSAQTMGENDFKAIYITLIAVAVLVKLIFIGCILCRARICSRSSYSSDLPLTRCDLHPVPSVSIEYIESRFPAHPHSRSKSGPHSSFESQGAEAVSNSSASSAKDEPEDVCPICLEVVGEGELVRRLDCQHEFHVDCIDQWFVGKQSSCCPTCKAELQFFDEPTKPPKAAEPAASIFIPPNELPASAAFR